MARPWAERAAELESTSGEYADFEAFCEWMRGRMNLHADDWDGLSAIFQVAIWSAVRDACEAVENQEIASLKRLLTASREREGRLREALVTIYEWYDRDGSVGGADIAFEDNRASLQAAEKEASDDCAR